MIKHILSVSSINQIKLCADHKFSEIKSEAKTNIQSPNLKLKAI